MLMRNNRTRSINLLGQSSKYMLQHYHDKPKEEPYVAPVKIELARHEKAPEVTTIDQSYLNEERLQQQMEQKKEKEKTKKKKLDFL